MNAAKTKARTAQLRADLSECTQTFCDELDHARNNAAKLRLSAREREMVEYALAYLSQLDYLLNT